MTTRVPVMAWTDIPTKALDAADRLTPASGSSTGSIGSILTVGLRGGGLCGVVVWPHHTAFGRHLFRPSSGSCGHDTTAINVPYRLLFFPS
eukprot:scaffold34770_cov627-Skeletonema_dohrnii-CCMP3373.AAC.1